MKKVPWGLARRGCCSSEGCQGGGHLPLMRPMLAGCLRPLLCAHSAIRLQHTQRCSFNPHVAVGVVSGTWSSLRMFLAANSISGPAQSCGEGL